MNLYNLKVNDQFHLYGKRYVVTELDPPKVFVIVVGDVDAKEEMFDYIALVTNHTFVASSTMTKKVNYKVEKEKKRHSSALDALDEDKRNEVSRKFEAIQPVLLLEKVKNGDVKAKYELAGRYQEYLDGVTALERLSQKTLLERISRKMEISTRTIKRYLENYRNEQKERGKTGIEGLIRKNALKSDRIRSDEKPLYICHPKKKELVLDTIFIRKDEKYIPILKEVIETEFLITKKPNIQSISDSLEAKCLKEKLEPLSYETVVKLLGRINKQIRERMRNGKKAGEIYDPIQRGWSNEEAMFPLHIVEIDHTLLDIDVIDKSGEVMGRPWITLGIDVYTRMVWCMYVSFERPSANKVRKAIQHGIFLKRSKEKYNTINEWDIHGIPSIIYMDNGPEFKNAEVKRMINETLQSEVRYRPVKTPNYGGTIERLFGTLNWGIIHNLDGTRKSSVEELGEYEPEKHAIYTLDDVIELLTIFITDIYHHRVHRSLPLDTPTPAARYYLGLNITGFPEWINEEDEEYYKIELLPTDKKPYTRDGVRLNNVEYRSNELSNLVGRRDVKYKIKYDIDDISKIYLHQPKTNEYVELLAANPSADELYGVNSYRYKKMREYLRDRGKLTINRIPGSRHLKEAKAYLKDKVEEKKKLNRKEIREAQKLGFEITLSTPKVSKISKEPQVDLFDLFDLQKQQKKL
ncbi:transposase [Brevibacillus sp. 7WMA2]|uniref:Mu transposase C-terminal domain-containing protein n=1 Tax=Brevibacillus sp. 7WMA2 TaxID=2683193 RepID=UPI0013A79B11|nr:Mu transposase C-terminal domain-containing protein [Brevibacillus sp. 7WMA2]QIC07170.1 transposase [Brevibacillus sp. 7WMA2]